MLCKKCGTQNPDTSRFCSLCGAPLKSAKQPTSSHPQQSYVKDPARNQKSAWTRAVKGTKVFYIIVGAIACLSFALPFLPSFSISGKNYNVFGMIGFGCQDSFFNDLMNNTDLMQKTFGGNKGGAVAFIMLMIAQIIIVPMALQIPWAILSFLRKRPAGKLGMIASIIYFLVSDIWLISLGGNSYIQSVMTAVPFFMLVMGIAGIVLSGIQLAKRKYLN